MSSREKIDWSLLECVWGSMVSTDKKTGGTLTKPVDSDTSRPNPGNPRPSNPRVGDERDVGTALRAAYQQAVEEKIPSEMLDLLGRLS